MKHLSGKNKFIIILLLAVLAVLFLPGSEAAPGDALPKDELSGYEVSENEVPGEVMSFADYSDAGYEIDSGIVLVKAGDPEQNVLTAAGSGVVYAISGDTIWIVTAGHVLQNAGNYTVWVDFGGVADSGAKVEEPASNVICDGYELTKDADLAFLQIPLENVPEEICLRLVLPVTNKARYDALSESDEVCVRGIVRDKLLSYEGVLTEAWIFVEDFGQYMMIADCEIEPGMSGGGLYDAEGNLIGIACGGNEEGELAAVPLHVVQARFADVREGGAKPTDSLKY